MNEPQRLAALERYEILDTLPEQEFDDITHLAAEICGTPIALISLVGQNRQWFKSRFGLQASETPREISFCGHVVADRTLLIVPDATQDERFADNPLVLNEPSIRFYAGAPLMTADNHVLGTLCVIDRQPKTLTSQQIKRLEALSRLVISQLELRRRDKDSRLLASVVESSADAIITETVNGVITSWNRAAMQLFGYEATVAIGRPASQLFPSEQWPETLQLMQRAQQGDATEPFETLGLRQDGTVVPIALTVSPLKDGKGQITGISKIIRDITESKQFTQTLEESNRFLELVLNTIPFDIFWKDNQYVYRGCNQRWASRAGLATPSDVIGIMDEQLPWTEEQRQRYRQGDRQVLTTGQAMMNLQEIDWQPDGQQRWQQVNKVPIKDATGQVIGVLGTIEDITERKQAEEALQRTNQELAQATRLKDEFLANMSHELRTPLNAILGMTEGLQEQVFGPINVQQMEALQTIERSGCHLLSLINDILDIAKIESGQVELDIKPVSVSQLCKTSLTMVKQQAHKKQIHLETQIPSPLPDLLVDERRLHQVMINLLNNAVKFTPVGGRITLAVSYQPTAAGPDMLQIAVRDTGIGISPSNIPKLFQPFIQIDSALNRQYEGTGLGLALVKRIVEMHGGGVDLTSEVGVGSCFTITLPVAPSIAAGVPRDLAGCYPPDVPRPKGAPRILLAEDNDASISTVTAYLEAKGYQILLAQNGQEAIALAQSAQPDLILMDIQMPDVDGLEATQRIRQDPNLVQVPIIALTALTMEGDRDLCLAAGADEYLSKPIKLKALAALIQQFLKSSAPPEGDRSID